jgi:hypothetical protein
MLEVIMARQKDIKLDNGSWLLLGIEPDWDRINELAKKVDDGDLSVLDELIDLIIYEEETEKMMEYIELGAKLGNDKARYIKAKELDDWNIQKLFLLRELADKDILRAKCDYEGTRSGFSIFYGGLTIIVLIGIGITYMIYQFLKCYEVVGFKVC